MACVAKNGEIWGDLPVLGDVGHAGIVASRKKWAEIRGSGGAQQGLDELTTTRGRQRRTSAGKSDRRSGAG
jgi:hypothetical protein